MYLRIEHMFYHGYEALVIFGEPELEAYVSPTLLLLPRSIKILLPIITPINSQNFVIFLGDEHQPAATFATVISENTVELILDPAFLSRIQPAYLNTMMTQKVEHEI